MAVAGRNGIHVTVNGLETETDQNGFFAITGRIWMLMIAHAAFDLTALAIIYWDVESRVAHLVFK